MTKSYLGWVARCYYGSIYETEAMEKALQTAFAEKPPNMAVFGITNGTRVAVTTTAGEETHLIANYDRGGSNGYMNSELPLWKA